MWYTGEDGPDPARGTATAKIDTQITVSYGLRANEQGCAGCCRTWRRSPR
jgi:hypothetical protein